VKYLLIAMISGCIFSIGTVLLKILVAETSIPALFTNPTFLLINIVFGGGGFVLSQISIKKEKASQTWLVSTAAANLIILLGGFLVLGEKIAISESAGVIMMILGSMLLFVKKAK
jgi:drug/metabolite transporter (DMT)-like permease